MPSPRDQMILTAAALFQREGYRATSWRKLVQESGAPWGSAHHYFPGGKEQLGVAAVEAGARDFVGLVEHAFRADRAPADGVRKLFAASATLLERSGFHAGCPVAPVALETAPDSQALTDACRAAFDLWRDAIAQGLARTGVEPARAGALATPVLAMFEGALLLARAQQSKDPMTASAEALAGLVGG